MATAGEATAIRRASTRGRPTFTWRFSISGRIALARSAVIVSVLVIVRAARQIGSACVDRVIGRHDGSIAAVHVHFFRLEAFAAAGHVDGAVVDRELGFRMEGIIARAHREFTARNRHLQVGMERVIGRGHAERSARDANIGLPLHRVVARID